MPSEGRWRENAPLYAIAGMLIIAFAALALFGGNGAQRVDQYGVASKQLAPVSAGSTTPPPLDALPANAEDTSVVWSRLGPEAARERNAAVPLAAIGVGKAAPFAFAGNGVDRERATACLALAALAEAGQGDADQRAVMQVVLNRVRHPAFAKTVCGVVFEGSQRATGCQFSFTCDGSLARTYAPAAMDAARRRAAEALGGYVHAPVGNATHYHADYVWPWWSPQLDKVAVEGPHIFYRWRGFWGTARALAARYRGGEPDPLGLERTAEAIERPELPRPSFTEDGTATRTITAGDGDRPRVVERADAPTAPSSGDPRVHFVLVMREDAPDALVERARTLCQGEGFCQVYGWSESAAIPSALPLSTPARQALRFSFLPARSGSGEAIFFDCQLFPTPSQGRCMPRARP
ncbi:MAG: cell wall hydrolase [Erythrobacter sp.]|nr:cell wall hydrolase [Erythrobacter sp.]